MVTIIDSEDLKKRMDQDNHIKLVMTMSEWQFEAKHIPGSICVPDKKTAFEVLDHDDEIVVYCSMLDRRASHTVARLLEQNGFHHVMHYDKGLLDWEDAGLPLEGTAVDD